MSKFRTHIFEKPKTPQEGLMRLAAALGRYEALREAREEAAKQRSEHDERKDSNSE